MNLLATPEADVQVGRQQIRVRATEAVGSERARLWKLMSEQYSGFDIYTNRTGREFKVFTLEPL